MIKEERRMSKKENVNVSFDSHYSRILLTVLFTLLGYFVYGGIKGALAILLLTIACNFILIIGIIPFVGWLIQGLIMNWVITNFPALTGFPLTWLTSTIFWVYLAFGILISIISSIIVLMALKD